MIRSAFGFDIEARAGQLGKNTWSPAGVFFGAEQILLDWSLDGAGVNVAPMGYGEYLVEVEADLRGLHHEAVFGCWLRDVQQSRAKDLEAGIEFLRGDPNRTFDFHSYKLKEDFTQGILADRWWHIGQFRHFRFRLVYVSNWLRASLDGWRESDQRWIEQGRGDFAGSYAPDATLRIGGYWLKNQPPAGWTGCTRALVHSITFNPNV